MKNLPQGRGAAAQPTRRDVKRIPADRYRVHPGSRATAPGALRARGNRPLAIRQLDAAAIVQGPSHIGHPQRHNVRLTGIPQPRCLNLGSAGLPLPPFVGDRSPCVFHAPVPTPAKRRQGYLSPVDARKGIVSQISRAEVQGIDSHRNECGSFGQLHLVERDQQGRRLRTNGRDIRRLASPQDQKVGRFISGTRGASSALNAPL